MESVTVTRARKARSRTRAGAHPFLFIALRCDRTADRGVRFSLADATTVTVGRGPAISADREGSVLHVGIPDPSISVEHLRVSTVLGGWVLEDLGSKNGTALDGRFIRREPLADGALIEAGSTFLIFRTALLATNVDAVGQAATPLGDELATLLPAWAAEMERARSIARSRVPMLLQGETGSGKELLAASIHRLSARPGAFQAINCAALPANLVESELFGYRRGAFSGAVEDHRGLLRAAERGTLLLDEIGDLPLPAQAVLLRVLEQGELVPVGGERPVKVDLRIVAATHRDLDDMVERGRFRSDLLARLSGYVCRVPPLRERREDFSLLVASLLARAGAPDAELTPEAARALLRHSWPRNVRELEKALSSAVALAADGAIDIEHLPDAIRSSRSIALRPNDPLRDELIGHLRAHGGNISAVARAMGKARTQIQRWLRRFELDPLSFQR